MKHFICAALLALAGCATIGVKTPEMLPVPATLTPAQRGAALAVNEAFVHITAGYNLVEQLANAKLASKEELLGHLDALDKAFEAAKVARGLYEGGDILSAQNQAELLNKGLVLLLKELNKRKEKS